MLPFESFITDRFQFNKGGGGGSGKVSYPTYMQDFHESWLDHGGADTITSSITDVTNAALGNSPWVSQSAYDPDSDVSAMVTSHGYLQDMVDLLSSGTSLNALIENIVSASWIDDTVDAYAADLNARLASETVPRYERGMQDINMVVSSAFVIGRAQIEENLDRQIDKFRAEVQMKAASDDAIKVIQLKLEYQKIATHILAELYRVKIVAKKEQNDVDMDIDERDAKWDFEVFQYGANLLASIGGGTAGPQKPSTAQSVLGGAISGGTAGAMMAMAGAGPVGWLAGAGAALGAASGLL